MPEVKVLSQVQVNDPKFEGSGLVAYKIGAWVIVRDDSNEYHSGIPLSSVTLVDPQPMGSPRKKLLEAFEEVTLQRDETKVLASTANPGTISYYKPDGSNISSFKLPEAKDNKELWLVTSFNRREVLEIPPSDNPRDIEIRHLRPFEIKSEIHKDGVLVGRDLDKEVRFLYDQLETILSSLVVTATQPFKGTRGQCLEYLETYLGEAPTWVFDGDEMLDALPSHPGRYLCSNKRTGRITRLAGTDKLCIFVDSRLSVVVKVLSHE